MKSDLPGSSAKPQKKDRISKERRRGMESFLDSLNGKGSGGCHNSLSAEQKKVISPAEVGKKPQLVADRLLELLCDDELNNPALKRLRKRIKDRSEGSEMISFLERNDLSFTSKTERLLLTATFIIELDRQRRLKSKQQRFPVVLNRVLKWAAKSGSDERMAVRSYLETLPLSNIWDQYQRSSTAPGCGLALWAELIWLGGIYNKPTIKQIKQTVNRELFRYADLSDVDPQKAARNFCHSVTGRKKILNHYQPVVLDKILREAEQELASLLDHLSHIITQEINRNNPDVEVLKDLRAIPVLAGMLPVTKTADSEAVYDNKNSAESDTSKQLLKQCRFLKKETAQLKPELSYFEKQLYKKVEFSDVDLLKHLWRAEDWKVLRSSPYSAAPVDITYWEEAINSLYAQGYSYAPNEFNKLLAVWQKRKEQLEVSIIRTMESLIKEKNSIIISLVKQKLTLNKSHPNSYDLDHHLHYLQKVLRELKESPAPGSKVKQKFLADISNLVEEKIAEYRRDHQQKQKEDHRDQIEKTTNIIKRNYLLSQIEERSDYLRSIYELNTQLNFSSVMDQFSGPASLKINASDNERWEAALNLDLINNKPDLNLRLPRRLNSLEKRWQMTDWLAARESALMMDHLTGYSRRVVESLWSEGTWLQKLLKHQDHYSVARDIVIDAWGCKLLIKFGTGDPAQKLPVDRLNNLIRSYLETMASVHKIITKQTIEAKDHNYYRWQLIRYAVVAELLVEKGEVESSRQELIDLANQKALTLYDQSRKLQPTKNSSRKQKPQDDPRSFCREIFYYAERSYDKEN